MAILKQTLHPEDVPTDDLYPNVLKDNLPEDVQEAIDNVANKQDTLVSGTNIKTVNGNSLLGSGNIEIKPESTEVDDTLSTTSKNPVQNKVITSNLATKQDSLNQNTDIDVKNLNAHGDATFTGSVGVTDLDDIYDNDGKTIGDLYQEKLVAGTNIKTLNGYSVLGSGDLSNVITKEGYQAITGTKEFSSTYGLQANWPRFTNGIDLASTSDSTLALLNVRNATDSESVSLNQQGEITHYHKVDGTTVANTLHVPSSDTPYDKTIATTDDITNVEANNGESTTATLSTLKVGDTNYAVGGGSSGKYMHKIGFYVTYSSTNVYVEVTIVSTDSTAYTTSKQINDALKTLGMTGANYLTCTGHNFAESGTQTYQHYAVYGISASTVNDYSYLRTYPTISEQLTTTVVVGLHDSVMAL